MHDPLHGSIRQLTFQVSVIALLCLLALASPSVQALDLGLPGGGSSCDPTKMSCVPGGGGGGGTGGGICALFPDKPECKPGGGGGGGTCTTPPGGSPSCGGAGPASTGGGGSAGVSVGGGNPINLISGNKYQEETDLAALPGVLGLELKRYYNSLSSHPGIAGPQWRLSYETVLYDLGSQIQILQADGRRLSFAKSLAKGAGSGLCTSPQLADGQVRIEQGPDGKPVYHWRWADGRTLSFMGGSGNGFPLHRISAPTGEQVQLRYNPLGDLVSVTDPQGRTLSFLYGRAGPGQRAPLEAVDTPLGRLRYAHDKLGRLTEAAFLPRQDQGFGAATLTRLYHYEEIHQAGNSFALTGISLRTPGAKDQRLSTYAYDTSGAAILTTRGSPQARDDKGQVLPGTGIEQLQVRYETKPLPQEGAPDRSGEVQPRSFGRIVLTNALGQTTVLRSAVIAGQLRLIDSRGAGCASCGPANVSYGYDREGRLIRATQLSPEGTPLRAELRRYDAWGRLAETAVQAYEKGKPQAPQWTQRLAYRDQRFPDGSIALGQQPVRIEQPSVIAGKTRATEIEYNDKGQVLRITERGWSPIDAEGRENPAPIERSTRYAYTTVAGKSLLAAAWEPGEAPDSPGTRLAWDKSGHAVIGITRADQARLEIERDATGRWHRLTYVEGALHQQLQARRDAWAGLPDGMLEIEQTAWWQVNGASAPRLQRRIRVPAEGVPSLPGLAVDMQSIDAVANFAMSSEPAPKVDLDDSGRPVQWSGADGRPLLKVRWGEGSLQARQRVMALEAGAVHAERRKDDFDRIVAIRNPYQGWQVARHDAAGRLIEWRDPRGARQLVSRDVRGRPTALQRFGPGQSTPEQTLRWIDHGDGRLDELIIDVHGERRTTTQWDALGRQVSQTLHIIPAGALAKHMQAVSLRIEEPVNEQGDPLHQRLVDAQGGALDIVPRRDAAGELVGLDSPGMLPAWLGGSGHLVTDIRWQHLSGQSWATHIRHADGSEEAFGQLIPPNSPAGDSSAAPAAGTAQAGPYAEGHDTGHAAWTIPGESPDAAGLPAAIHTAQGRQGLQWNAAAQLQASTRGMQDRTEYVHDARGRRVLRWRQDADGTHAIALFLYDDRQRLLAEADASGRFSHAYAWVGYRAVAQLEARPQGVVGQLRRWLLGTPSHSLHTDLAGRVQRMVDGVQVLWSASSPAAGAAGIHQPLRHVGQVQDEDSGLIYHGARFFSAEAGRFISPDPAGIADAVNATGASQLLDLYAFAAGQADLYFDPDGAARIRYFAITTDAKGKALGTQQGYTKARWAFIVDRVAAPSGLGGDATLRSLQTKYAGNQQSLLVDVAGDFLVGKTAETWLGESGVSDLFKDHYGDHLISTAEFTVTMKDDDATRLIASYIAEDRAKLYGDSCPARKLLLPPIRFAAEDPVIDVSAASSGDADKQRILACGAGSATDIDKRRIAKYEAASEINETAQINRDCSTDGCPGIGYYCDATKCYAPRDQLKNGPPETTATVYTPSYGRSQFIGATMVSQLLAAYDSFTAEQQTALGMTAARKTALSRASDRGAALAAYWESMGAAANYAAANAAWSHLTAAQQTTFTTRTGLGEEAYTNMKRMLTKPPTNSKGVSLLGDAKQALVTAAIMSDADIRTFLMGIFQDFDKFTTVSHNFMRSNLDAAKAWKPEADERYLAAMVARAHNGGNWKRTYDQLTTSDAYDYVKNFIGTPGHKDKGDWNAIRCTESFGKDTLTAGKNGKGIGGLQMTPLTLP